MLTIDNELQLCPLLPSPGTQMTKLKKLIIPRLYFDSQYPEIHYWSCVTRSTPHISGRKTWTGKKRGQFETYILQNHIIWTSSIALVRSRRKDTSRDLEDMENDRSSEMHLVRTISFANPCHLKNSIAQVASIVGERETEKLKGRSGQKHVIHFKVSCSNHFLLRNSSFEPVRSLTPHYSLARITSTIYTTTTCINSIKLN